MDTAVQAHNGKPALTPQEVFEEPSMEDAPDYGRKPALSPQEVFAKRVALAIDLLGLIAKDMPTVLPAHPGRALRQCRCATREVRLLRARVLGQMGAGQAED
jgi:hypothetical protein